METKTDVLLGLQWGDEGKGKIVDVLTPAYDIVARFQGGPNAGHTITLGNRKYVLHTIPSGIFNPDTINVIGNGVLIDPYIFAQEIASLSSTGIDFTKNILISRKAHLILPTHRLLDAVYEKAKGKEKIGSTLKGIGPAYTDKTGRRGLRVGDLELSGFEKRYQIIKEQHLRIAALYDENYQQITMEGMPFEIYEQQWFENLNILRHFQKTDSEYFLNRSLTQGKKILAEGAQGTLLDVDFGAYPFVTSSNTSVAGVCSGLGIPPARVGKIVGIFKAYCTRVGSGPFPTELFDFTGEKLREKGHEFGATTGRPRRCGWLDLPALKYAVMLNGVTELFMMKADVLSGFSEIKVATGYKVGDKVTEEVPFDTERVKVEPVYRSFQGWKEDLSGMTSFDEMPSALKTYIRFIEEQTGVPVRVVSVGPDRQQTVRRDS
jgi:adenylosuccinate synthase